MGLLGVGAQRVQAGEDVDGIGQLVILVPKAGRGFGDGLFLFQLAI
jgi:hypothetical protein